MDRERLFVSSIQKTMDVRDSAVIPIESKDVDRLTEAGYLSNKSDTHYVYPASFHMVSFHLNDQNELTITHFRLLSILAIMCWLYVPLFCLTFGSLAFVAYPGNTTVKFSAVLIGSIVSLAWTVYCNKFWRKEFDYPRKVRELLEQD